MSNSGAGATPGAWLEIGRVRSVQAQRREARIEPRPGREHEFAGRDWLRLRRGAETLRLKVESIQSMGDTFRVVFAPGVPREVVGTLRGSAVLIAAEDLRPRPERPWQVTDLVGLQVRDEAGQVLGEVARVYETAADGAFEVLRPDGTVFLLPAIPEVVVLLDLEAGALTLGDIAPYVVDDAD